jgi:hypothetical protein
VIVALAGAATASAPKVTRARSLNPILASPAFYVPPAR